MAQSCVFDCAFINLLLNDMAKIPFSVKTFGKVDRVKIKKVIMAAAESNPEFRAEIRRVFHMANRRIENIEKAGVISPAVQALNKGDIEGFSKFSMQNSWEDLKLEYGRAVSFLRQPTSTLTGAREYGAHIQDTYDLTEDEYKGMAANLLGKMGSIESSAFIDRYLMRYKDFTGEMEANAQDISAQLESDAKSLSDAIDREINRQAEEAAKQAEEIQRLIAKKMDDIGKFTL